MRLAIALSLGLGLALVPSAGAAQDADTLRTELAEMRRQFETMKGQYERAIEALSQRLQRLETSPTLTATPGPTAPSVAVGQAPPGPAQPSLTDLARPRQPFALATQRGPGQFLFDLGIAGDFVANLTQRNVDKANAGTFVNRENRLFPREVELSLFGQIDPYARGEVRVEAGERTAGGDAAVNLAEAHLTLLTLPWGTQAKLGQMRSRFGLLNQLHPHDGPQIDRPNVLARFLGEEGLVERGGELTWIPPLPFYLEGLVGIFDGDNAAAFGRGKLSEPLLTGRLRTFLELGDTSALQLGISGATGETGEKKRSVLAGADLKYKLRPDGWQHPLLTVAGEGLWLRRAHDVITDGAGEERARRRFGWYGYGEVQPWKSWAGGVRFDSTEFPVNPGREWAVGPYLSFMPSEFLRFRLGYKHTERSHRDGFTTNEGSGRTADEVLFQATFLLGAHPAHPF
jgi:hypothetical protein